jgi:hypothetical protein
MSGNLEQTEPFIGAETGICPRQLVHNLFNGYRIYGLNAVEVDV